jgi:hypothetical protein
MSPKTEKKLVLTRQPLALHEIERKGWKYRHIESFGAFDIQDALRIILQRILLADPELLAKAEILDDQEFTHSSHRSRRYIAKHLDLIYLQKDEAFAKKHSRELYGYWFPKNIGFKELSAIFHLACSASGCEGTIRPTEKDLVGI